jgi:hypothetical protein
VKQIKFLSEIIDFKGRESGAERFSGQTSYAAVWPDLPGRTACPNRSKVRAEALANKRNIPFLPF